MNTLIVYATKYGATKKIAGSIANMVENATLYDICGDDDISLSDYDCVVLGSPLMAGRIRKEIKKYISDNFEELNNKRVGIFLSGLEESDEEKYFKDNFSQDFLDEAIAKAFLGGIFDPEKCGFVERKVIKAASKIDKYTSTIDEGKIASFAQTLSSI